jgi:hypothetical protein
MYILNLRNLTKDLRNTIVCFSIWVHNLNSHIYECVLVWVSDLGMNVFFNYPWCVSRFISSKNIWIGKNVAWKSKEMTILVNIILFNVNLSICQDYVWCVMYSAFFSQVVVCISSGEYPTSLCVCVCMSVLMHICACRRYSQISVGAR